MILAVETRSVEMCCSFEGATPGEGDFISHFNLSELCRDGKIEKEIIAEYFYFWHTVSGVDS